MSDIVADHPAIQPHPEKVDLSWNRVSGLGWLSVKIFLLRLVTLGIYHFWGKTEVRRKIWSAVHLQQQPLEYTGLGKELFYGFVIIFLLILLPAYGVLIGIQLSLGDENPITIAAQLVFFIVIMYLIGVAQYRARRYRLSRTHWRGIRGSMAGSPWQYGWTALWTLALVPLTLGWITPWRDIKLSRHLTDDTRFGTTPMAFKGGAKSLYGPYAILWLGMIVLYAGTGFLIYFLFGQELLEAAVIGLPPRIVTILAIFLIIMIALILYGVISAWYRVRLWNYIAQSTHIDQARFHLSATPLSLVKLYLGNGLLALFTLGIAMPVVQARIARYFIQRLRLDGSIDFAQIAQSQEALSRTGEGLAEAFDIDAF